MDMIKTFRSEIYKSWYSNLTLKEKRIVDARIDLAREQGTFVRNKLLDSNFSLYEFKWDSGLRVYFSLLKDRDGNFLLLLTCGNKNSQSRDITDAKKIILKAVQSIRSQLEELKDGQDE